jgi:hypothetical protein
LKLQTAFFGRVPLRQKFKAPHGLFQTASYSAGKQPPHFLRIHSRSVFLKNITIEISGGGALTEDFNRDQAPPSASFHG